jgi:hypothetical protein
LAEIDDDPVADAPTPKLPNPASEEEGSRARAASALAREKMRSHPFRDTPAAARAADAPADKPADAPAVEKKPAATRLVSTAPAAPATADVPAAPSTLEQRIKELEEKVAAGKGKDEPAAEAEPEPEIEGLEVEEVDPTTTDEFKKELLAHRAADPECQDLIVQYNDLSPQIEALLKVETIGGKAVPRGGEILTLSDTIHALKSRLDPKAFGLKDEPPDVIEADEIKEKLDRAEAKRETLVNRHRRLLNDMAELDSRFARRVNALRDGMVSKQREVVEKKRAVETRDSAAKEFDTIWNETEKELTRGLAKEDADHLKRMLALEVNAVYGQKNGDILPADLPSWMAKTAKTHVKALERDQAARDVAVARDKDRDIHQPAPRDPKVAVAAGTEDPTEGLSPRERRRFAEKRASGLSRSIVAR